MVLKDFLTFQTFITPSLLIFVYYVGALIIPILSWYLTRWIETVYKTEIETSTTFKKRFIGTAGLLICFFSMEILWRMMFEFFIAYFDMHDALMKLA